MIDENLNKAVSYYMAMQHKNFDEMASYLYPNKELFLAALKETIIARGGVTKISKEAHINRQHIYKMLSSKGNPSFDNIGSLLTILSLQLKVETNAH